MQKLHQRLTALGLGSLKEWFARRPWERQFILMLSQDKGACFILENEELKLEIAPCYFDHGKIRRETIEENDHLYETVVVFFERETGRKYSLAGNALIPIDEMEALFSEAEEAYEKDGTGFRPAFLFDYVENHAPKKKGGN